MADLKDMKPWCAKDLEESEQRLDQQIDHLFAYATGSGDYQVIIDLGCEKTTERFIREKLPTQNAEFDSKVKEGFKQVIENSGDAYQRRCAILSLGTYKDMELLEFFKGVAKSDPHTLPKKHAEKVVQDYLMQHIRLLH